MHGPGGHPEDDPHLGPGQADPARGLSERQRAGQQAGARQPAARVPRHREAPPGEGGVRAGHVHQHRGQPDQRRARQAGGPGAGTGPAGGRGGPAAVEAARRSAGGAATARRCGRAGRAGEVRVGHPQAGAPIRHQRRAQDQRPELRVRARLRPEHRTAGSAEVALRVPVPLEERRPGADPASPRPDRRRAAACDRPDPDRDGREGVQAEGRGEVRRDRRPGGRGRAGGRGAERDLRAPGGGARPDGGHAGARLQRRGCGCFPWRWRSRRRP